VHRLKILLRNIYISFLVLRTGANPVKNVLFYYYFTGYCVVVCVTLDPTICPGLIKDMVGRKVSNREILTLTSNHQSLQFCSKSSTLWIFHLVLLCIGGQPLPPHRTKGSLLPV
jgi:hypothetical protein